MLETARLSPAAALTLWRESIGALYDVRACAGEAARFHFRAEAYHFGEIVLTAYRSSAQTFDRSRARIGRDGIDHITLQFCLSGRHGRRDGWGGRDAGPGDLLVADLAQPQATETSDFDSLNLTVPRRLLAPLLDAPDEQNLRRVSGTGPLPALLRNHLIGLFQSAPLMSGREAEAVVRPTLALAAAVLNSETPLEHAAGLDPILTAQIRRFLSEEAASAVLTAEQVAAHFGISQRKLSYLMEPHGGFASCLREHRLHLAYTMLRNPAQRGTAIADVAQSCGFAWRTNFARTFRRRYGMTPQETRALAARRLPAFQGDVSGQNMWEWIQMLR
ncbi:helix-turn-helix domain-containing protein [Sphingomonas sp. So64.6b]|uniref:helix-turn-helix domain-containing protein n=1 Tax=Sphingomonas sp. So64.6b TaxID=2997354 RepID=UPI0016021542|nr:helix-turn-helix domain-containing protein [Sphingomonas sp. So64.6b]QNA84964.1 helix-turn-helix domain-containing protein [Sphingomonas sp. So64.6b]